MKEGLAEKSTSDQVREVLIAYNWDRKSCPLYEVAGCLLFRGCLLSIEVNGRRVGTFRIVHYTVVFTVEGCSLSGVLLHSDLQTYPFLIFDVNFSSFLHKAFYSVVMAFFHCNM